MVARGSGSAYPVATLAELVPFAATLAPANGIVDGDLRLATWPNVHVRVCELAGWLRLSGVGSGDRVVVVHPKSANSFIAMHAVLAVGAIAVPVDPRGPWDRLNAIIQAVEPAAMITAGTTLDRLGGNLIPTAVTRMLVSDLDACESAPLGAVDLHDAVALADDLPIVLPDERAYVIFTSGSTGVPKGIVHTHRSALAYATQALGIHRLDPNARVAGTSPLHFDMSTLELYAVPLAGATAVTIRESDLLFPVSLARRLVDARVTHLYAVPYLLKQLLERAAFDEGATAAISQVAFGGEQVSLGSLRALASRFPQAELLNVYGPAEVNGVMSHSFGPAGTPIGSVPIGTQWPGIGVRVVDGEESTVDRGDVGELYVTTESAMQNYWGQEFSAFASTGEYPTGDLVREDNGVFYFLGRRDNRVKVRGVRIELEEVERQIGDAPGIAHVVVAVVIDAHGQEILHAWVVPSSEAVPTLADVREWSRERLASVAVPASLTIVETMPTTQSGKIDRGALLANHEGSHGHSPTGP